jgi:UDP-N-acetylglucosamine transferase subunit ALG13
MNVFVTVGSELPFDRLIRWMDRWAGANPHAVVFAQTGPSSYVPEHLQYCQFLTPAEFTARVKSCDLIVAHAGMGSILTSLQHRKPILVLPRRVHFGEVRSEHQVATAQKLREMNKVLVADTEDDLEELLVSAQQPAPAAAISEYADSGLLNCLTQFIHAELAPAPAPSRPNLREPAHIEQVVTRVVPNVRPAAPATVAGALRAK